MGKVRRDGWCDGRGDPVADRTCFHFRDAKQLVEQGGFADAGLAGKTDHPTDEQTAQKVVTARIFRISPDNGHARRSIGLFNGFGLVIEEICFGDAQDRFDLV